MTLVKNDDTLNLNFMQYSREFSHQICLIFFNYLRNIMLKKILIFKGPFFYITMQRC